MINGKIADSDEKLAQAKEDWESQQDKQNQGRISENHSSKQQFQENINDKPHGLLN